MDNYWLRSPGGSVFNLGSYLDLTDARGPDFGDGFMLAEFAQNPVAEGGRLAFQHIGVRRFSFPLILKGNASTLPVREAELKLAAVPGGAQIRLQPDGVPSAEQIYFDVLAGRYKPAYAVREHGIGVRRGALELDVKPFGYWATEIILASAASVGLPGRLAIPGGSVLGDVPGLARIVAHATLATQYAAGTWMVDVLGWSLAAASAASVIFNYSAFTNAPGAASTVGDVYSPITGSWAKQYERTGSAWSELAHITVTAEEEEALRGHHRLFLWAKLMPSVAQPAWLTTDVNYSAYGGGFALGSAAPIATLPPAVASGNPGAFGAQPSPAYTLLDMGEIAIPAGASGANQTCEIRVWAQPRTPSTLIRLGGAMLLPVAHAGLIPRGVVVPQIAPGEDMDWQVDLDGIGDRLVIREASNPPAGFGFVRGDIEADYRGVRPQVGPSVVALDLLGAGRKTSATDPVIHAGKGQYATVAVTYRPRFAFLRGL